MAEAIDPQLRTLYPNLDEKELKEASENLDRYIELVLRIYERLTAGAEQGDSAR